VGRSMVQRSVWSEACGSEGVGIGELRGEEAARGRRGGQKSPRAAGRGRRVTGRGGQSINELWRHHIFQLSLTFHGGTHMIAYPWGDFIHFGGP